MDEMTERPAQNGWTVEPDVLHRAASTARADSWGDGVIREFVAEILDGVGVLLRDQQTVPDRNSIVFVAVELAAYLNGEPRPEPPPLEADQEGES